MSIQSINNYYNKISQYKRFGGTRNETSLRRAFANLLEEYCLAKNLQFVDELIIKTGHALSQRKRPDGTVRDALQLDWGFWESKDTKDNFDEEIKKKIEIGYPTFNLLFENSEQIVLYQQGVELLRGDMTNPDFLHKVLIAFVSYERPEIKEFHAALKKFKEDIPVIIEALRAMIANQEKNPDFRIQREKFWNVCRESINPDISAFDIREMLIQHILTAEIFDTAFNSSHFHRENNIARELETVINTFFTGKLRRDTLASIDNYYKAIKAEAARIDNHHQKQKFLKVVYENFYKAYNPKGADRLGVVYTPNEIVKFMVESTDYLLEKYFSKSLADKNVQILDPATGTGTFITEIIEHIPPKYLKYKYKNEIHCNELAILPYYIANLNIEFTYQQKMNEYEPYENIVFVDTLDNLGFEFIGKQQKLFAMTTENLERIQKQNAHKISVIIGNPPYNANQMNENDNNKNREYPEIDKRIKDTFIKHSTAQKTKVYDMYARFFRWAMDRIDRNGIIAFITNRSYIDSRTFDGFRKIAGSEFNRIYIIDLGGDVRQNPKLSGTKHNVFGIQTGVAIIILLRADNIIDTSSEEEFEKAIEDNLLREPMVRYGSKIHFSTRGCRIHYYRRPELETAKEKLEFLQYSKLKDLPFEIVHPDKDNNWINLTDNDWNTMLPTISYDVKNSESQNVIFKTFSNGIATNRDEWVYDDNSDNLERKVIHFINRYNELIDKSQSGLLNKEEFPTDIKWSHAFKNKFRNYKNLYFDKSKICAVFYRPFKKKFYYCDFDMSDLLTTTHFEISGDNLQKNNKLIWFKCGFGSYFFSLVISKVHDIMPNGGSKCFPLYRYDKFGNRIDNITDWGLKQFTEHYKTETISKEDIFHYTYSVLHNPAYRKKYELNLKREFPRLPFYKDFWKWAEWGKELMDLHIGYENVEPYKLKVITETIKENPKAKLKAMVESGEIVLDENTSVTGIPNLAWDYKLGNRSAIHWILDQYKEKKPTDPTIAEKFNTYRFADYKDTVIDLLKRVTTVSVRTMEIVNLMEDEEPHIN